MFLISVLVAHYALSNTKQDKAYQLYSEFQHFKVWWGGRVARVHCKKGGGRTKEAFEIVWSESKANVLNCSVTDLHNPTK